MGLFGSDSKAMGEVETVVGQNAVLKGTYNSKNSLRVDGEIIGNVSSEDGVVVGRSGTIRGNIMAKSVVVGGRVKGNITAYQKLELQSTAQLEGDITTPALATEEGALFEGTCRMKDGGKVVDLPKVREN
jgi:cytoskeletal protein CcmA (bactofilin family)